MTTRTNEKVISFDISNSFKKSNTLSLAKLNHGLTLNQTQLLSFAIYNTQHSKETHFYKDDFEEKFGLQQYRPEYAYEDVDKLMEVRFSTQDLSNDSFDFYNVFQRIKFEDGLFTFKWGEDILPHIIDLKEKYVLTDLKSSAKFNSGYSWILYDYLRALYGRSKIYLSKEELLNLFNVEKVQTYNKNVTSFRKRVIDVAISEINEFTELKVSLHEKKKGRKILGFEIRWSRGTLKRMATESQIKKFKELLRYSRSKELEYINMEDLTKREQCIRHIREMNTLEDLFLKSEDLTENYMQDLLEKLDYNVEMLDYLLKSELEEPLGTTEDIPLFNWLEPDKKIEFGK